MSLFLCFDVWWWRSFIEHVFILSYFLLFFSLTLIHFCYLFTYVVRTYLRYSFLQYIYYVVTILGGRKNEMITAVCF